MKTCHYISYLILGAWLLFNASASSEDEPCRVFTDVKGRTVEGRLVEFNVNETTVTIQRADEQTFEASLAVFSEADQMYILEQWFKNAIKVSAELKDFGKAKTFDDPRYKPENIACAGYAVLLENGTAIGLSDIEIEYCIYYRQYRCDRGKWMVTPGIQRGCLYAPFVPPGANQDLMTAPVMLYNEALAIRDYDAPSGARGEIEGTWIRATANLPSGKQITREFRDPANIGKDRGWPKSTVLAGIQADMEKKRQASLPAHKRKRGPIVYEWRSKSTSR